MNDGLCFAPLILRERFVLRAFKYQAKYSKRLAHIFLASKLKKEYCHLIITRKQMIEFQQDRGKRCISTYVNTKVARSNMSVLAFARTVREKRRNAYMMNAGVALPGTLA
jgi:hypothetical protein